MKLFTKHTPADRGRIKVTIESDVVVIREFWRLVGDAIPMLSERAPQVVQAYKDVVKAMAEFEELNKS